VNVAPIVARLAAKIPPSGLLKVGGAADFQRALEGVTTIPAAFVIPLAESAAENDFEMSIVQQEVSALFGVMLAVRNISDATGSAVQDALNALRMRVRDALVNWQPDPEWDPCTFAGGQLIGMRDQVLYWQDDFQTGYQIRKTEINP
jgi:hypothetical protein